jgi:phosphomannomutase
MIPFTCFKAYDNRGKSLVEMLGERMAAYPCSREINYCFSGAKALIRAVLANYAEQRTKLDATDHISPEFADLRMILRLSNIEPFLRLNIEAQAVLALVAKQVQPIEAVIREMSKAEQVRVL